MKTFNEETKQHWISVMQEHQDAERIIAGHWWDGQTGCFFGCVMQQSSVDLCFVAEQMHLPVWLVYLAEKIHENLPENEMKLWPVRLLNAIPTDTEIDIVQHKIAILRLTPLVKLNPSVAEVIQAVIDCHELYMSGGDPDWSVVETSVAATATWAAAEAAAWLAVAAARAAASAAARAAASSTSVAASAAEAWSATATWAAAEEAAEAWAAAEEAAEVGAEAWSAADAAKVAAWSKEGTNLVEALQS